MTKYAPICLAAFGASFLSLQMPTPHIAFGGLLVIVGIVMMNLEYSVSVALGRNLASSRLITLERVKDRHVENDAVLGWIKEKDHENRTLALSVFSYFVGGLLIMPMSLYWQYLTASIVLILCLCLSTTVRISKPALAQAR